MMNLQKAIIAWAKMCETDIDRVTMMHVWQINLWIDQNVANVGHVWPFSDKLTSCYLEGFSHNPET